MRQLRAKCPMKGIAVSGFGMEEDIRKSKEAGFIEHLTKPVGLQTLIEAIQQARARRRGSDKQAALDMTPTG